jgi:ferredoxin-type protein NapH
MRRKVSATTIRVGSMLLFFLLVIIGLATNLAPGTLSSFGFGRIALICPLGALETMIASRTLIPLALTSLLCLVVVGLLLGKIFCAWVCPVPLTRLLSFKKKEKQPPELSEPSESSQSVELSEASLLPSEFHSDKLVRLHFDSRFLVLVGALATTAVFGFPVFCLVCPIGLTFATVIGIWRLIGFNEPSWLLFIFPAMLVLELLVFKKWCNAICPLGAIFSLVSSLNKFLRPRVDESKCLRTSQKIGCTKCKDVCFEQINLHNAKESKPLSECTKCKDCASVCPTSAISFNKKR